MQEIITEKNKMVKTDHLKEQIMDLSERKKARLKRRFMEVTGKSYGTFYYKLNNNSWSTQEREILINILENVNG